MKLPFELLNPAGLWALTAIPPLVVLYILKVRRQRLKVPSTWLWAAAQRDLLARSPFKKLTPQIPLLLELLAVLLLALALSQPATRSRAILGDHLAIIVDTSASMSALDPERHPHIELAKRAAKQAVDAMNPGADAIVLEAARSPKIVAPLDRDRRRLREAIERLNARDVEGNLVEAIALAVDRLRQLGGTSRVVVFTDGALAHADALSDSGLPVDLVKVAAPTENVGIVRLDVRTGRTTTPKVQPVNVFAMLGNFGTRPRDVYVTLREANASDVLASRKVLLKPGEQAPVVLDFDATPADIGQGLILDLSPHDSMPVDDVAYARVPEGARIPVILASTGGRGTPWLQRALQSDLDVQLFKTKASELAAFGIPKGALVVVDGACPAFRPPGDLLVVNPPKGNCFGTEVGSDVENPGVTSWARSDARLRFLTLEGVHISKSARLKTMSKNAELVHGADAVLVADISTPGHGGTLIGFDVGESNWPLRASFVLFIRNVVELARTHRARGMTASAVAGKPIQIPVPYPTKTVTISGPGKKDLKLAARRGLAILPAVDKAGIYLASWDGPPAGSTRFAVNLTSDRESDVRPKPLHMKRGGRVLSAAQVADAHTSWSWLLALLALGFVLADIWYVTRRARPIAIGSLKPRRPERSTT